MVETYQGNDKTEFIFSSGNKIVLSKQDLEELGIHYPNKIESLENQIVNLQKRLNTKEEEKLKLVRKKHSLLGFLYGEPCETIRTSN